MCAGALIPETQFHSTTTASVRSLTVQSFPRREDGRWRYCDSLKQPARCGRHGADGAYEKTLRALRLVDRGDPITELVARKVIEIGQGGVRDPAQISRLAVEALS
jgi:hypothetical protein